MNRRADKLSGCRYSPNIAMARYTDMLHALWDTTLYPWTIIARRFGHCCSSHSRVQHTQQHFLDGSNPQLHVKRRVVWFVKLTAHGSYWCSHSDVVTDVFCGLSYFCFGPRRSSCSAVDHKIRQFLTERRAASSR